MTTERFYIRSFSAARPEPKRGLDPALVRLVILTCGMSMMLLVGVAVLVLCTVLYDPGYLPMCGWAMVLAGGVWIGYLWSMTCKGRKHGKKQ